MTMTSANQLKQRQRPPNSSRVWLVLMVVLWLVDVSAQAQVGGRAWLRGTPQEVLAHALTVTSNQPCLIGKKARLMNDPQGGFEYYQRRAGGQVERKWVVLHLGEPHTTTWHLSGGKYLIDSAGLLFQVGFDEDFEIESRLAHTVEQPYEYRALDPARIGTNVCAVIRRSMAPALLDAVAAELYAAKAINDRTTLARKYARAVRDFYIRQDDGLILGELKRNVGGDLLVDRLCEEVSTRDIPAAVFEVPRLNAATNATTFESFSEISRQNKEQQADGTGVRPARSRWVQWCVSGVLIACALIPPALWLWTARRKRRAGVSAGL